MKVVLKTICSLLICLTFIFNIHSTFAVNKKVGIKKLENIRKEELLEDKATIHYPGTTAISLKAKQAIVLDYLTGRVLLEKHAHEQMPPSSMTKIMTSFIIEEKLKKAEVSLDTMFTVSEKAWRIGGSKSFMPLGKQVKMKDILRGIIIQSGNDACIVAAEGLYGSEERFVEVMNKTAEEIGMRNTHFVNSNGWFAENHYSTAHDIALLSSWLVKTHPEFYHIYSERNFTYGKDKKGNPITQGNRNPLLYKDLNCDGIKTGYTDRGGYGIAASFIDKNRRYIIVINGLNSMQERSDESTKIVHWVKQNFNNKKLYSKGEIIEEVSVKFGVKDRVHLEIADDIFMLTLNSTEKNDIKIEKNINSSITAPIKAGECIGKIVVTFNDSKEEVDLIAKESIERMHFFKRVISYISSLF